jgi:hypothetical protein
MPTDKKVDAFHPQQPAIPGVSNRPAQPVTATRPAAPAAARGATEGLPPWLIVSIAGVLMLVIVGVWWKHRQTAVENAVTPASTVDLPSATLPSKAPEALPTGPGEIGTTDEVSKAWSSKKFLYQNPVTDEHVKAMVVRLPGGAYWGFSLKEPFGTCELEWVTDLGKLKNEYGYRADHPMVGDPCNHSVFDLTQYVSVSSGMVRGQVVQGAAVRPPMAIEIETKGNRIVAGRSE